MFEKKSEVWRGRSAIVLSPIGSIDLSDTFECGQAFRYELVSKSDDFVEYMTVVGDKLVFVGQRKRGELMFFDMTDEELFSIAVPYFSLNIDFEKIADGVVSSSDSEWLARAADASRGISILKQDAWEALFSFIISQNNNIPRIRKIIRAMALAYGKNLAEESGIKSCPLGKINEPPSCESCKNCGACYSFPTAEAVASEPEKMLPSHPGFRFKYLLSAAERVASRETDLSKIEAKKSYEYTLSELKKILGVGDKVASCAALFGFGNFEAFPIDVWMKRAIDKYFGGHLDPKSLGEYAGVIQQYIFHYIRNFESKKEE